MHVYVSYIGGFFTERRAFSSVYKILACEIVFFVDTMLSRDRSVGTLCTSNFKMTPDCYRGR